MRGQHIPALRFAKADAYSYFAAHDSRAHNAAGAAAIAVPFFFHPIYYLRPSCPAPS